MTRPRMIRLNYKIEVTHLPTVGQVTLGGHETVMIQYLSHKILCVNDCSISRQLLINMRQDAINRQVGYKAEQYISK